MAKKKIKELSKDDIRKLIKAKKLVIGTDRVAKLARLGKLDKVFMSQNAPKKVVEDLEHYCKLGKTELIKVSYANDELGELCNKPFSISVLGVIKG
jgi:large subunit ribosomal protein L30e